MDNFLDQVKTGVVIFPTQEPDIETKNVLRELKFVPRSTREWVAEEQFFPAKPHKNTDVAVTAYVVGVSLDEKSWGVFKFFCEKNHLQPVVVPIRYKNPSSLAEAMRQEDEASFIDPRVLPYLLVDRVTIQQVTILSDVKVQVTATNPIATIGEFSRGSTCILPHIQQGFQGNPRMLPDPLKLTFATGTITKKVYGDHLAAKRAEFNHVQGWCVLSGGTVRLVHCFRGDAIDLGKSYSSTDVTDYAPIASFWGDSHFGQEDSVAHDWAKNVTINHKCQQIILNDTFDGSTINHHEKNAYQKNRIFSSVAGEIGYHNQQMEKLIEIFDVSVMCSNHNNWLDLWLNEVHPMNLSNEDDRFVYGEILQGNKVLAGDIKASGSVVGVTKVKVFHGHETVNGGRMTYRALSKIGSKSVHGHTHSPYQYHGVFNPGCLCLLEQDYTKGSLTSWGHGVAMIYPNNVVQVLLKY